MKKHYKEMIIIALIMSVLINIVAWGEEGLQDGIYPTDDPPVLSDNSSPSGDDVLLLPIEEPEEPKAEEPKNEENKNEDPKDPDPVEQIPDFGRDNQSNDDSSGGVVGSNGDSYNDWYIYSVSVDSLKLAYFDAISLNTISINEVLIKNAKVQRNIEKQLSRIDARDADYQTRVLYYLSQLAKLVSGNGAEMLGLNKSTSMDEIRIALSLNDFYEVSEDMIEYEEEISENSTEEPESVSGETVENISADKISIDSVSKADIEKLQEQNEQLHDDLKGIFIVNIFAVLFLALLTAGQLEQIIFKRIRG